MDLNSLMISPPWEWPKEAGNMIAGVLRNRHSATSIRTAAAELAGDLVVMNDRMADVLLQIVSSADEPVQLRSKAAISLGPALEDADIEGFDDPIGEPAIGEEIFHRIQETLHSVYGNWSLPKELRRRALEASVRASQEWHAEAIRAANASGDEEWVLTAAFCMRYVPGFDNDILRLLDSPNPDIHHEAVCAAGDRGVRAAWPHISALLASEETDDVLRLAAIEAAGGCGGPEAIEVLHELAESEDDEIAEAASDALMLAEPGSDEFDDEFEDEEDEDDEESSPPHVH